ncbi:MAG: hypothetical protein IMX04_05185 [Candidatus Carbobacillus altaicus]|nr:hypothetical protein [Candidatus Carbobacillus altaicus]
MKDRSTRAARFQRAYPWLKDMHAAWRKASPELQMKICRSCPIRTVWRGLSVVHGREGPDEENFIFCMRSSAWRDATIEDNQGGTANDRSSLRDERFFDVKN